MQNTHEGGLAMDLILIQITKELLELYDSITTKELADRIGVSMSSVRHRMTEVKDLFAEYGIEVAAIPKKGILLEASAAERDTMYNHIQDLAYSTPETREHRKDYILKTLFEYSDNYTVQLFAEDLFVSKKIISEDLEEVTRFLEKYDVKLLIKKNKGITIDGNEFDIRQAMIAHYNSLWWHKKYEEKPASIDRRISRRAWTYMKNLYGDLDVLGVQRILLETERSLNVTWTDIAFGRLLEYAIILKRRIQKGWIIAAPAVVSLLLVDEKYYQAAKKALSQLSPRNDLAMEVKYLAARIYVAETIDPMETENSLLFKPQVKLYLKQVGRILGHDELCKNTRLIIRICQLLSSIQYRRNYKILYWTDSNRDVRATISGVYAICLLHSHILEEGTGLTFKQDNIADFAILINNYLQTHRKEVIYVNATDNATAHYQLDKLQRTFSELRFVKAVHFLQFSPETHAGKTIVSTVDLKYPGLRVYHISKHVDDKDIEHLKRTFRREHEKEIGASLHNSFLHAQYEINASSRQDAVEKICAILAEDYQFDKISLTQKIKQNERALSSATGNGIALPHVIADDVPTEMIAEFHLKHRILWDNENLASQLILLAVREDHVNDALAFLLQNEIIKIRRG